ncbi:ABC multidrug transporter-like protein [Hortaea werneckii]|nr:ABC multidrug transporter-like protein [Hortaea werneckii]KAI7305960.1 ABC multidrug transporter-like protein [Hortaea werneckii]
MFIFSASYYHASAGEFKQHDSHGARLRSVVFSRFGEAITGIPTIRAYGLQNHFARKIHESVDDMDGAYFLTFGNQRRLSVRLDLVGDLLVFTVGILVMIQFTVRQLAEVENNMNSAERIHYYGTHLEEEDELHNGDSSWPEKRARFDNVQMRCRPGLPLVLKGLNMDVKSGERTGMVNRTRAGESTIMSTIFRLIELTPTLFRDTIRRNLDPFDEHSDLELWNALRQADLVGAEQAIEDEAGRIHLDTAVENEGLNFWGGNASFSLWPVRSFAGRTLLIIAHRLKTIIGHDRILVIDHDNVAELDSPIRLYDAGGIVRSMCDRSGICREDFFNSKEALFQRSPTLERTKSAQLGQSAMCFGDSWDILCMTTA